MGKNERPVAGYTACKPPPYLIKTIDVIMAHLRDISSLHGWINVRYIDMNDRMNIMAGTP
jgi:hypothetical protein